jgi:hypothetical protein
MAEEETEFIKDDDGVDRIATKAEALGYQMWRDALGWTEKIPVYKDGVQIGIDEIVHSPDKNMKELIFNRIEGRAPLAVQEGDEKITATEKVTEEGKKRISQAGGLG